MRKRDPQFSHTEFYGLVQSYMKLWFLSAEPSDLGCISEVENCQDTKILDVDCLSCKASRVWADEVFIYVEMRLKVRLICAQGEKLVKRRTACTVRMKRRKEVTTTHRSDVLQCANCGAYLDLLGVWRVYALWQQIRHFLDRLDALSCKGGELTFAYAA